MPKVRILVSAPPGYVASITDHTQPGGQVTIDIGIDFSPVTDRAVEAKIEEIEALMVQSLKRPSALQQRLKQAYGMDSSTRSKSDLSNVDTSGLAARPSQSSRNRVTSRLPSWWLAVTTAPIMSTTVPKAAATAFWMAIAVKSSICKILSRRFQAKPKTPGADSATRSEGQDNA